MRSRKIFCAAGFLLAALAIQIAIVGAVTGPNCDDVGHLAAGLHAWDTGQFDVYRVNPPLTMMIAALPVLTLNPKRDYRSYAEGTMTRVEWRLGHDLIVDNPTRWEWYFVVSRWMLIPLILTGGGFRLPMVARVEWPDWRPILTVALLRLPQCDCLGSDNQSGYGIAAAMGIAGEYAFWKWLRNPTLQSAILAGIGLGLAELTKFSWILLFPIYAALWLLWRLKENRRSAYLRNIDASPPPKVNQPPFWQLATILLLGLNIIHVGYGFEGSFTCLGKYAFLSRTLTGAPRNPDPAQGENRFEIRGPVASQSPSRPITSAESICSRSISNSE